MSKDEGLRRIHLDPRKKSVAASASTTKILNPVHIPWPADLRPQSVKMSPVPKPNDPLPKADVLVVTWTSGEARTMGTLFAGQQLETWFPYKNNVAKFIPLVTGPKAPFNDRGPENKRYYQSLGLYCQVKIGDISVICLKSGLHPAYDGPAVPLVNLWQQLISQVQPKLLITTGTGGGIGSDIQLGDVVIAANVKFDATGQFKDKPWAHSSYPCSPLNEAAIKGHITPKLLKPNGDLLKTPRVPNMIYPSEAGANVVTTDTFAFDDSSDHYKLQGLGKCCDMGDATLGLALSDWKPPSGVSLPTWVAIRNASDPQIPNPTNDMKTAQSEAESIYSTYQEITTAGSVVATWATIVGQLGKK